MMEPLSIADELVEEVERRYGIVVIAIEPLSGGYECDVALLYTVGGGRYVLRVSPASRSVEELAWAYDLAFYAGTIIPEVVAPLAANDGSLVFEDEGRPVSLFPFVGGHLLERGSVEECESAARLLGRLHRVLPGWPHLRPRPEPPVHRLESPDIASSADLAEHAAIFLDRELDAWLVRWRTSRRLPTAPLHADFYPGNLLCSDGRVVGLLDWDDVRVSSREYELAWSVWEFAQAAEPDATIDADRAAWFLAAYAETGPVDVSDRGFVVPLIRAHLRYEVARAAAWQREGIEVDEEYVAREIAAFEALRTQRL
jgi:Ser/Thr protein kinase RdoA (MazF antagonist)